MAFKQQGVVYTMSNRLYGISIGAGTQLKEEEDENKNPILETGLKSDEILSSSNMISLLNYSSSLLLDNSYSNFYNVQKRLRMLNERLTTLEIKKRLKDHLAAKQTIKNTNKKQSSTKHSPSVEDEVKDFLDELVDKVIKTFPSQEELELESLKKEKVELSNYLESQPSYMKVCCLDMWLMISFFHS